MTRTLYIVRGLPSAGKTDVARVLAPEWNSSLDDFRHNTMNAACYEPEVYPVLVARLKALVTTWLSAGRSPIAVANVHWSKNDVYEWAALAASFGYRWAVIHVETDLSDHELADRSQTKCPAEAIGRFRQRWQPLGE